MTPIAKGFMLLVGAGIVMTVASFQYFESTGETRMGVVCGQLKPGDSLARLREVADENRLFPRDLPGGVVYLENARSYGKHVCKVTLENGTVTAAGHALAD